MSKRLDENLGDVGSDNLINGAYPPAEVFSVQLAPYCGVLERGTLLARVESKLPILWDGNTEGRDVLELTIGTKLYKVSDLTPEPEDIMLIENEILGNKTSNGAVYNSTTDPSLVVVYNTSFNFGGGIPGTQTAPSTGIYCNSTELLITINLGEKMVKLDASSTGKANAVLAETVDANEATVVGGIAYRTGHFNTNSLIVADGYEITAADKEALRVAGILLSDAVEI